MTFDLCHILFIRLQGEREKGGEGGREGGREGALRLCGEESHQQSRADEHSALLAVREGDVTVTVAAALQHPVPHCLRLKEGRVFLLGGASSRDSHYLHNSQQ